MFATALKGDKPFLGRAALEAPATGSPRAARGAGWSRSSSRTPTRCCGAASCCSATAHPAGQVTSAAWGETVGACVGLAYLRSDGPVTADSLAAGRFEVDVAGERFGVRLSLKAPWPDARGGLHPRDVLAYR